MNRRSWLTCLSALFLGVSVAGAADTSPLVVVVMDPLSAPLSCDCVQGYAQRKYELLGEYLQQQLHRPVRVVWSESLAKALNGEAAGQADLVIGKDSVVRHDAKATKLKLHPVAALSGKDGVTSQYGVFVVRAQDSAQSAADLKGYRIFFGPEDCDEKWSAPREHLQKAGVAVVALQEQYPSCSNAASVLVELPADVKAAAIISSYAEPLLEGCGTVKKGDLRVVAKTEPLPFITAFVNEELDAATRESLRAALLKVEEQADLLTGLETLGFVPVDQNSQVLLDEPAKKKS